jgi:putative ABC transport system substrate-binding protein
MKRRAFIALLGGAAAWPITTRAQQAVPVIGFLSGVWPGAVVEQLGVFRQVLKENGYIEGSNLAVEYRWAEGQIGRLPALAAELVRHPVQVIVAAGGDQSVFVAKAATTSIPVVFTLGADPVKLGIVASLNRPGGNLTGVTQFTTSLEPKRFQLLTELVPQAAVIAMIVNPDRPASEAQFSEVEAAARADGRQLLRLAARSERDIEAAFIELVQQRAGALLVASDAFFFTRRELFVALAARHAVPTIYQWRDFVTLGGLMSYGTNLTDAYRVLGSYTSRILKGEKPADLPVQQVVKVDLVINLKTATTLGLTFPHSMLGRADEVIE